jgi:predicted patatin/cPLA2 family phospholipase
MMHLSFTFPFIAKDGNVEPIPAESSWIKSEVARWMGNYNTWYKIDKKTLALRVSYNKKKWKSAERDIVWLDNKGRWLFITDNKLMCSENGKNWSEITNRSWQDMNGTWYRFDSNWDLWEVKL